jgi:hypothetical protein
MISEASLDALILGWSSQDLRGLVPKEQEVLRTVHYVPRPRRMTFGGLRVLEVPEGGLSDALAPPVPLGQASCWSTRSVSCWTALRACCPFGTSFATSFATRPRGSRGGFNQSPNRKNLKKFFFSLHIKVNLKVD